LRIFQDNFLFRLRFDVAGLVDIPGLIGAPVTFDLIAISWKLQVKLVAARRSSGFFGRFFQPLFFPSFCFLEGNDG